jgi:hypothetical protein
MPVSLQTNHASQEFYSVYQPTRYIYCFCLLLGDNLLLAGNAVLLENTNQHVGVEAVFR